jgi:hypothetical protein
VLVVSHDQLRAERARFAKLVGKAKEDHWNEYLENIDANNVWQAHKYLKDEPSDHYLACIPNLRRTPTDTISDSQTNQSKSKLLYETFFKPAPDILPRHDETENPLPPAKHENITDKQITRVVKRLSSFKAPGPNGVCNAIFVNCADTLVPHMGPIFRATFNFKFYPEQWKISTTVVLRKPGRPDYSIPKAYRPIALLDTMAKILSACIAEDITHLTEKNGLLPATHFRGRPGQTTTDSILLLTKFTHDTWSHPKEKFVSMIFLDIKAAFPSIVVETLIHNMWKRGVPEKYTGWLKQRLAGRCTSLSFNNFKSNPFQIPIGLDQGCPLSPIAFLFYNADLIDIGKQQKDQLSLGFIDDTAFAARGTSFEEANQKLQSMMERPGGALEWSGTHRAEFEIDKTALLCATRTKVTNVLSPGKMLRYPRPAISINGHSIEASKSCKFLGVFIDEELLFKIHVAYAITKGTKYVLACKRLTKVSRRVKTRMIKKLYKAVAIPKMLYTIEVWGTTMLYPGTSKREIGWNVRGFAKKIETIQCTAAILITGGMASSATDLLFAHTNLDPITVLI